MNDTKVSQNRQKKEVLVSELSEKTEKAKALVFTNYQGLTHKQLEELKKGLKATNSELVVAKNTLLKLALKDKIKIEDEKSLEGPTATIFVYEDVIAPLKELAKTIKLLTLPSIKFGILDGQSLNSEQLIRLSALPSREVLLSQVVYGLKSPIFGLHRALSWNLQKLVMVLSEVSKKKPAEAIIAPQENAPAEAQPAQQTEENKPNVEEVKV
jgi:large subunit ribosomal protein L10